MKITEGNQIGEALKAKRAVTTWRKSPGDFTAACVAARHYAERDGDRKIVVPGNSYGARVYNIVNESEDLRKFTVVNCEATVAVIYPDGRVLQATATPA